MGLQVSATEVSAGCLGSAQRLRLLGLKEQWGCLECEVRPAVDSNTDYPHTQSAAEVGVILSGTAGTAAAEE